ncbi:hypothetical protein IWQ62_002790 [Dispira parvispora]|uniref:15-cis-phytoene synthase n=1 Tax=Dispira parvispora TaxID=1520584 RepID=A0A9W8E7N0_9FUNG|nr:hypothetical protein IWQ62_002790 [Dispira parvispora]
MALLRSPRLSVLPKWHQQFIRSRSTHSTVATSSGSTPGDIAQAIQHCQTLVRKQDYYGYLASLFFPKALRPAVWSIRALNLELASIRDTVSDTTIGQMKMLFWKQALEDIKEKRSPPHHPVALALADSIPRFELSTAWFTKLINTRSNNLVHPVNYTLDDLEQYSEGTASTLLYLQLECLGIRDVEADHTASHLGKAIGITTLLRATPYNASKRLVYLPQDILAKHRVSEEDLCRQRNPQSLSDAVFEISTRAHDHILTAQGHLAELQPMAFTALLVAVPYYHVLKTLEQNHFDVFSPQLQRTPWRMPYYIWKASRLRKIC